jgi:hypothetical protein
MKKILVFGFSAFLLAIPALVLADSAIPIGQTPVQILTTAAALEAQESAASGDQTLACAALLSAPSVKVNEPVALAWGSIGALNPATASSTQPMWTPDGGTMVSIQTPGPWTYSFTFYSASGASVTCTAKILVTQ